MLKSIWWWCRGKLGEWEFLITEFDPLHQNKALSKIKWYGWVLFPQDCHLSIRLGMKRYRPYRRTSFGQLLYPLKSYLMQKNGYNILVEFSAPAKKLSKISILINFTLRIIFHIAKQIITKKSF